MYKIAICEDDVDYIGYMKKIIISTKIVDEKSLVFYDFYDGEQLCLSTHFDFDLIIMDMQLKQMSGYNAAMKMREIDRNFLLVFISGVRPPFSMSFKANPFRYLLKGCSKEEMVSEMREIIREMKDRKKNPFIICRPKSKEKIKVYPESVVYVSKFREFCEVHIIGKLTERYPKQNLTVNMKLGDVHQIFNEDCGFVRAHNSYIINMMYIVAIDARGIRLANGEELTYSRARTKEFKQVFARFASAKYQE